ncbi:hypothetical protein ACQP1V_22785 [Microtetraspora malaysiensis]|uniref:hypothetical protein n=1 Tax=Microtetraspora malaysiensis TaxID=161358 RepID=UPI003D8E0703
MASIDRTAYPRFTRAVSARERREVHLREKCFYRMLYETVARAEEILPLNIEDLDFAGRRALVKAKGAQSKARRRGQAREDFVLEPVYWDAGTARLLKNRTRGPVFVTHRCPGPGTGWDLHEFRHSGLTHLGEQGASLLMLMAKSRPPNSPACSHPATHAEAAARDRVCRPVDPDHPDRHGTTEPWS